MHIFLRSTALWIRDGYVLLEIAGIERQKKENTYNAHARVLHYTQLLTVTYSSGKPYLTVSFLIVTDSWYWMDVYTEDFCFLRSFTFFEYSFIYTVQGYGREMGNNFSIDRFYLRYIWTYIYNIYIYTISSLSLSCCHGQLWRWSSGIGY